MNPKNASDSLPPCLTCIVVDTYNNDFDHFRPLIMVEVEDS
jgi:hypothetical protein